MTRAFPDKPSEGCHHIIVQPPSTSIKNSLGHRGSSQRRTPRLHFLDGSRTIYKVDSSGLASESLLPAHGLFRGLITEPNVIAADRTMFIEELDRRSVYQYIFLRLRRWGTFLQMLADYYDKSEAEEFENNFVKNATFLGIPDRELIDKADGTWSLLNVLELVKEKAERLFVGVDEYDSAANSCFFSRDKEQHSRFAQLTDLLKTKVFNILKNASGGVVQKYWLTGVLPVFRGGFSPLSSATSIISRLPQYNGCCGLTEDEVQTITTKFLASTHSDDDLAAVVQEMKLWYGGYSFSPPGYTSSSSTLYNPRLVFTHLQAARSGLKATDEDNATFSTNVLKAISNHGDITADEFLPLLSGTLQTPMATEFGAEDAGQVGENAKITWGLLYYNGIVAGQSIR